MSDGLRVVRGGTTKVISEDEAFGIRGVVIDQPANLRRSPAPLAMRKVQGLYALAELPQEALRPAAITKIYVDLFNRTGNASDANTGLTKASPLLTMVAARAKITADGFQVILIGPMVDTIYRETANAIYIGFSHSIVCEGPGRILFCRTGSTAVPTWTAVGGKPGVFSTPIAAAADAATMVDTNDRIDMAAKIKVPVGGTTSDQERWRTLVRQVSPCYFVPTKVASVDAVAATPGAWFYDAAAQLLYYQARDCRNLVGDQKVQPLSTGVYWRASNGIGKITHFAGFDILGGSPPIYGNPAVDTNISALLILENIGIQASASNGGSTSALAISGPLRVIAYRVAAWNSWGDLFSYSSINGVGTGAAIDDASPTVIEIECVGSGGGMNGSTGPSDNVFTSHVSSDVQSYNCVAIESSDRPVADVHKARRAWYGGYIGAPADIGGVSLSNYGMADQVVVLIDGAQFAPPAPGTPNIKVEGQAQLTMRNVSPLVTVDAAATSTIVRA